MNTKSIRELAEFVRESKTFDQGSWIHNHALRKEGWCGTAACVAGHAVCLFAHEWQEVLWLELWGYSLVFSDFAGDALGLTDGQAGALFGSCWKTQVFIDHGLLPPNTPHLAHDPDSSEAADTLIAIANYHDR